MAALRPKIIADEGANGGHFEIQYDRQNVEIGTIEFLVTEIIYLESRIMSISVLRPKIFKTKTKISNGGHFEIQYGRHNIEIGIIGFLAPENIYLEPRIKSIAALRPKIIEN
jgi:hypothetical protein